MTRGSHVSSDPVAHGTKRARCEYGDVSVCSFDPTTCPRCTDAWDEADYRRDGDQALDALAASIRDYHREGEQEGTE